MIEQELIQEAKKEGFTNFEITTHQERYANLSVKNETLNEYMIGENTSYHIKAEYQGTIVSMNTEKLDKSLLDELKKDSKEKENKDKDSFLTDTSANCTYQLSTSFSPSKELPRLLQLNKLVKDYPSIYDAEFSYSEEQKQIKIENMNGVHLEDGVIVYTYYGSFSAKEEDTASNYCYLRTTSKDDWNLDDMTKQAMEEIVLKTHAKSIATGTYPVIIRHDIMGQIMEKFSSMFSSDLIQKGKSPLIHKEGKEIFSNKITIMEDPTDSTLCGYRRFDNEGTKTSKKVFVENGKWIQAMYDNRTALKEGKVSTGNQFGMISMRNAFIVPGEKSLEELMCDMKDGIFINGVSGIHVGLNLQTGDFSLQAEGWKITSGKKERPLKLITIAGNIFDLMKNVVSVGRDLVFESNVFGSPSIYFSKIQVSGLEEGGD